MLKHSLVHTFRYPFVACEVFTCEIDSVFNTFLENEEVRLPPQASVIARHRQGHVSNAHGHCVGTGPEVGCCLTGGVLTCVSADHGPSVLFH